jgi:carbonic anhydrase
MDWDAPHHNHHHHHHDSASGVNPLHPDASPAASPPASPSPAPAALDEPAPARAPAAAARAALASLLAALARVLRVPLASGALGCALGALAALALFLASAARLQTRAVGGGSLQLLPPALLPPAYNFTADVARGWGYISDASQWDEAALGPLIGPAQWPALAAYPLCAGAAQSPAALSDAVAASGGALQLHWRYNATAFRVAPRHGKPGFEVDVDDHREDVAGQVWVPPGAGALPAEFVDFHFHAPSEHTLNGERFALEAHFVHRDEARAITVLGVLFRLDEAAQRPNPYLRAVWPDIFSPETRPMEAPFNLSAFAGDIEPAAYSYSGSLTTPPCAAAAWVVAVARTPINMEQLSAFAYRMGNAPTARPLQALNGREVLRYSLPPGAVSAPPP